MEVLDSHHHVMIHLSENDGALLAVEPVSGDDPKENSSPRH